MAATAAKMTTTQAAGVLSDDVIREGIDAFGISSTDRLARVKATQHARAAWPSDVSFSLVEFRERLVREAPAGTVIDSKSSLYRADQAGRILASLPALNVATVDGIPANPRESAAFESAALSILKAIDDGAPVRAVAEAAKATAGQAPVGPMHAAVAAEAVAAMGSAPIEAASLALDKAAKAKAGTPEAKAKALQADADKLAADMRAMVKRVATFKGDDAGVRGAAAVLVQALGKAFPAPTAAPVPTRPNGATKGAKVEA